MMEVNSYKNSLTLVGLVVTQWVLVERKVEDLIAEALDLDYAQTLLFRSALSAAKKHEVLKTLIKLLLKSDSEREHFIAQMGKLKELRKVRNIMAHDLLIPTDDDTVVIFRDHELKDGDIQLKESTWTAKEFAGHLDQIDDLSEELDALRTKLKQAKAIKQLAEVLSQTKTDPFVGLRDPE